MVRHRIDRVSEASANGYWIKVLCRCGNNTSLDPQRLVTKGGRVGLTTRIDDLFKILKCRLCGQRPYDLHLTLKVEK